MAVDPDLAVPAMDGARSAATLVFEHVSKHYDGGPSGARAAAVNDVSLTVPAGRICVLVGPSGCGKTTSLKMVNRLIEPTSGRILLDDVDVATREVVELRRGIGYVIQQVGLFPHLRVWENVATVPRLLGWSIEGQRARSDELLALVGLDPVVYATRFPAQLSGGERQRVGVARALAADPPLMLMDEPFGAVDPIVRDRLQNEFLRIQGRLAKTILFVTHDIDEAIKMGDIVAVMDAEGRLAQFGTPAAILTSPVSEFVARFVGADRGLKRLSLTRVAHLDPAPAPVHRIGAPAAAVQADPRAQELGFVLLADDNGRPAGWLATTGLATDGPLSADRASPATPLLEPETTLKDALSMLIDADVLAGIVVDHAGRVTGLLTAEAIIDWLRAGRSAADAAPGGRS